MNDIHIEGLNPHQTTEQLYESFSRDQKGLAKELESGVFAPERGDAIDYFNYAYYQYTGDTSTRTYIESEDRTPVIDYIASKIDTEGKAGFDDHPVTAEEAVVLYRKAYDRYDRLARNPGHHLGDPDQMARLYFPMRDLYRRGASTARSLGDEQIVMSWQKDWLQFSNGCEEEVQPYDEEHEERTDLYERFLLDKDNSDIWDEVAHHAQHEDERGEVPRYELHSTSTPELNDLAGLILSKTKDKQYAILTQHAANGETWNKVLSGLGALPLARTLNSFLKKIVSPEELVANKKVKIHHAAILGGRDVKAIDLMVFSKDRTPKKGWCLPANPIAENVTVIEPSDALRAIDERFFGDEQHVAFVDGLPTDMPLKNRSQQLIVGTRNTEGMNGRTLSDFYLELSRVLKHGGVYVESNGSRATNNSSFNQWKSLLAQMIVDTVEDRGTIPDRMDSDKEKTMLKGLGLTEQIFNLDERQIRVLVKEGAVKEIGWHMLEGMGGVDRLFGIKVGEKPDEPRFVPQKQTNRNMVVW